MNKKPHKPKGKSTNIVVYLILAIGIISILVWGYSTYNKPLTTNDPFAYCASINTVDAPDVRYTGDKIPQVIVRGLRQTLDVPSNAPDDLFSRGSSWRCMNGEVYACNVGANLPCESKANVDKNPTEAEKDFCSKNPNADIPEAVTGHDTLFEWRCNNFTPRAGRQIFHVDARGYISEIWHKITPVKN